jgi:NADH dehydrogenase [ubiquinone] 1 alpha subcomplex assembly factor 6
MLVHEAALPADARGGRGLPLRRVSRARTRRRRRAAAPTRVVIVPGGALSPLAEELRRHDRDRFQTVLFAPAERRDALIALYEFNYEVARIREVTSEPLLGRIRLQWWRDTLAEIYAGAAPRRHDVAEALSLAIREHRLSRAHFDALLEARELDLADQPPASLGALEAYVEGASASLVLLALEILDVRSAEAATVGQAVGIAYALAGLLMAVPFHAGMKRLYLPQDMIDSDAIDIERGVFELKSSPGLIESTKEIAALARYHLGAARAGRAVVPREALPALLPAVLAERRLDRLEKLGHDVMDKRLRLPDTLQSWRLAWAAFRQRY